jgi:hypothetical protein
VEYLHSAFTLNLGHVGRSYSGFEEVIDKAGLSTWSSACSLLSAANYEALEQAIEIRVSWNKARECFESSTARGFALFEWLSSDREDLIIEGEVTIPKQPGKSLESLSNQAVYHLALFLYDVFAAMNLSSPGCCEFQGSIHIEHSDLWENHVVLYASMLESAWLSSLESTWPTIQYIPLGKVVSWLRSLEIGTRQIANSRVERGIFSLLHVCRLSHFNPETLIWLAHALEALYDTPPALVAKHLQQRIIQVLDVPAERQKWVKKQLRQFYELRSSFVHGNLDVVHPLENERLDPQVVQYTKKLMGPINFGIMVVLATLQKHIVENWREVTFTEVCQGVSV